MFCQSIKDSVGQQSIADLSHAGRAFSHHAGSESSRYSYMFELKWLYKQSRDERRDQRVAQC